MKTSRFFIHCESNGISSTVRLYIIKGGVAALVSHHTAGVYKITFRNDDIQDFVLMICNFYEIDDIQRFALIEYINRFADE